MTTGMGLRSLAQATMFLIVARVLGVTEYGAYSAVAALAMTLGGFSGLGASMIMLRETARDRNTFKENWGRALAAWFVTAPVLFITYLLLSWGVLPCQILRMVVICIGLAEVVFAPLTQSAIQAYQGHERIGRAARILLAPVLTRLAAACLLLATHQLLSLGNLLTWAIAYLMATGVSTGYVLWLLNYDLGVGWRFRFNGLFSALREGWAFAIGGVALKVYADIDKIMLARLSTLASAGSYSAAYRVVDVASVPMMSFFAAVLPRFFRAGGGGVRETMVYALRVCPFPLAYAMGVGMAISILAPFLPILLGSQFAPAVGPVRWLAWLPLLSTPRLSLQTAFGASGRQGMSVITLGIGAVINLGLNLWMIPTWGWLGAALATYCSELVMALVFIAQMISCFGEYIPEHKMEIVD